MATDAISIPGRIRSTSTPTSRPRDTAIIARPSVCETLKRSGTVCVSSSRRGFRRDGSQSARPQAQG